MPDGMKVDTVGNVYTSGDDWKTLYFATRNTLFAVNVIIAGTPVPAKKSSA